MKNNPITAFVILATLLSVVATPAGAYQADASVIVTACSAPFADIDGGLGFDFAQAGADASGECGPTPEDDAQAQAASVADIANGFAFVSGQAEGVVGANRATSSATFIDQLSFSNVPAEVDSVTIEAALDFVVDYGGTFDFANELVSGNVSVASVGEIRIRQCNIVFCPDDPPQSDMVSAVFVVERNMFTNEFPVIDLRIDLSFDVANSGGFFSGQATVDVIDGSGAVLVSDSGVFGTGSGADIDADGVPNALDNCTTFSNADQRDTNGDGFGNECDADINDDCSVNFADLAALGQVFFPRPYDPDADFNGDGSVSFGDLAKLKQTFFTSPQAGPGPSSLPNACFP